jgi:hypothetical protein
MRGFKNLTQPVRADPIAIFFGVNIIFLTTANLASAPNVNRDKYVLFTSASLF